MQLEDIKDLLNEGDINSDGFANDIVKIVLNNNIYFDELLECLENSNNKIRVHASDAVEKILRVNTDIIELKIEFLLKFAKTEKFSYVKMHYAMIFAYIFNKGEYLNDILDILFTYLTDKSAFVTSWTISTLTIIAEQNKSRKNSILEHLMSLQNHESKAVQNRLQKALLVLTKNGKIPKSWIKNMK